MPTGRFKHSALPYATDALAPFMSAETLEFHHGKHHLAYVNKANELIAGSGLEEGSDFEIMKAAFADPKLSALFNNVAQAWNHSVFWQMMKPNGGGDKVPANLEDRIRVSFGDFNGFRSEFINAGMGQFGSGWVWLVANLSGRLSVIKTPNGENPVVHGYDVLLGCDVWEHSYYIDYRNARQKYLETFVDKLINWDYAEAEFSRLCKNAE